MVRWIVLTIFFLIPIAIWAEAEQADSTAQAMIAVQLDIDSANAYHERGYAYFDEGCYDKAIAAFSLAIGFDPSSAEAYNKRGITHQCMGNADKAIADYDLAIGLDSNDATIYVNRGSAYNMKGNFDAAIADFNRAIELDPESDHVYRHRGQAYLENRCYNKAIADYDILIKLGFGDAQVYNNRGRTYLEVRNFNKAIEDLTQAIKADSNYAQAYQNRSIAYYGVRDFNAAIADNKQAKRLVPHYSCAYHHRDYACEHRKRFANDVANVEKEILARKEYLERPNPPERRKPREKIEKFYDGYHHLGADCLGDIEVGPLFDFEVISNSLLIGGNFHRDRIEFELSVWPFVLGDPHITGIHFMMTPFYYKRGNGENYYSVINIKSFLNVLIYVDEDYADTEHSFFGPFASINYTPYYSSNRYTASAGILYRRTILFHIESGYRIVDKRERGYYVSAGIDIFGLLLFMALAK